MRKYLVMEFLTFYFLHLQELQVRSNYTESNPYEHVGFGTKPDSEVISKYLLAFYSVSLVDLYSK